MTETLVSCDMTISLDGYITGLEAAEPPFLDDGFFRVTNWVVKYFDLENQQTGPEAELVAERIETSGTYVLGRRMYDSAGDEWSVEAPYKTDVFVVTHRPRETVKLADGNVFHFVTGGMADAIERAKQACAPGKKAHVSGGADIVQQALAAGLIDELHIHIAPVLLGQGKRLFDNLPYRMVELDRYRVVDSPDATHLSFRIPRS